MFTRNHAKLTETNVQDPVTHERRFQMLRFVSMLALMAVAPVAIGAGVPTQINHQGVVSVNGLRFTGSGDFKFAIVDPGTGNFVWTNDDPTPDTNTEPTNAVMVTVTNGVYSVALGDMVNLTNMTEIPASLFADFDALKLRIWFNDGVNGSQQLSPDQPLTTSPYAFRAVKADTADFADAVPAGAGAIPGEIRMWAGPIAKIPAGWLVCDGSLVSRGDNPALFLAIGESWGEGDDVNTFNLPDLRGRFVRGVDAGAGRDPDASVRGESNVAGNMGDSVGSVQGYATAKPANAFSTSPSGPHIHAIDGVLNHSHLIKRNGPNGEMNFDRVEAAGQTASVHGDTTTGPAGAHSHGMAPSGDHTHVVNGGGDMETRPVNAYVYFIIKQ